MIDPGIELQGKRVLVTGAAGFIGSRLVEKLLSYQAEVLAMVNEDASLTRIESLMDNKGLKLIRCSLNKARDILAKRAEWGEIDFLAHLWVHVPTNSDFCEQSIADINMNLLSTMKLTQALGKGLRGICFASSVSVYGFPDRLPLSEKDPAEPITSYGVTKLAIENFLKAYGKINSIPVAILRYATIYGPGEFRHRAIPNFIRNIAEGQPPLIYGDGSEMRDYVYIDDAVRATVLAMAGRKSRVLNIGSGRGYSTMEIAQTILKLYPADMTPRFIPGSKPNISIVCDISAAREVLSYSPQTSLEDGLTQEIEVLKKHMENSDTTRNNRSAAAGKSPGWWRRLFNYSLFKNIFDRFIALLGLTAASPLMVLIALGIILDSRGNPIFAQERIGEKGHKFTVYKFRTMYTDNDDRKYREYLRKYVLENAPYRVDDNGQGIYKVVDDSHITRFGALLRKTNLDELPQLVNVLKGDMSLIGPRPDVPFAVTMYNSWHRERLYAKPGMTGLWQVGRRKNLSFEDMVRLDIDYIQKKSLKLDTKIILQTISTILEGDGS